MESLFLTVSTSQSLSTGMDALEANPQLANELGMYDAWATGWVSRNLPSQMVIRSYGKFIEKLI